MSSPGSVIITFASLLVEGSVRTPRVCHSPPRGQSASFAQMRWKTSLPRTLATRPLGATYVAIPLVTMVVGLTKRAADPTGNFTGVFVSGPAGTCPGAPYDLAGRIRGPRV